MTHTIVHGRRPLSLNLNAVLCRLLIAVLSAFALRAGDGGACVTDRGFAVHFGYRFQPLADRVDALALQYALHDRAVDLFCVPAHVFASVDIYIRRNLGDRAFALFRVPLAGRTLHAAKVRLRYFSTCCEIPFSQDDT